MGFDLASTDRTVIFRPHKEITASVAEGVRVLIRAVIPAWAGLEVHSKPC